MSKADGSLLGQSANRLNFNIIFACSLLAEQKPQFFRPLADLNFRQQDVTDDAILPYAEAQQYKKTTTALKSPLLRCS
jgi:hypothetical protein